MIYYRTAPGVGSWVDTRRLKLTSLIIELCLIPQALKGPLGHLPSIISSPVAVQILTSNITRISLVRTLMTQQSR